MKFQVYEDKSNEWRWRLVAINGNIIADSGEGYKNRQDCLDMVSLIRNDSSMFEVEFLK